MPTFYVSLKIALLLFDLDELILQSPQLAIDFLARVSNNVGLDRDFCNEFAQDSRWHLRQIHSSGHYSISQIMLAFFPVKAKLLTSYW